MKHSHKLLLEEITNKVELSIIYGGAGSGDWGTGAQTVWGAGVGMLTGKNCSWPGGFYGPVNSTPTGSGVCTGGGWNTAAGRECIWDPHNDNDVCY